MKCEHWTPTTGDTYYDRCALGAGGCRECRADVPEECMHWQRARAERAEKRVAELEAQDKETI